VRSRRSSTKAIIYEVGKRARAEAIAQTDNDGKVFVKAENAQGQVGSGVGS